MPVAVTLALIVAGLPKVVPTQLAGRRGGALHAGERVAADGLQSGGGAAHRLGVEGGDVG